MIKTNKTFGCNKSEKIYAAFSQLFTTKFVRTRDDDPKMIISVRIGWNLDMMRIEQLFVSSYLLQLNLQLKWIARLSSPTTFSRPRESKANDARKVLIENEMFGSNVRQLVGYLLAMRNAEFNFSATTLFYRIELLFAIRPRMRE